jgi:MYXO-CTERM domain-containing protein
MVSLPRVARAEPADPFGKLELVDEIDCGDAKDAHTFAEAPAGASSIDTILGAKTRVLVPTGGARYFAYVVGKDKGLVAGQAYVLEVEFPEDEARTLFVVNRGSETTRGINTGASLGDVLESYGAQDHESLAIPLSGKSRSFRMFFHLHDRLPELVVPRDSGVRPRAPKDGFWVAIAQPSASNVPLSKGAAASKIRLWAVPDEEKLALSIAYPPSGLPRRHVFFREEMSDGVVNDADPTKRGVDDPIDWYEYKAKRMRFLGMNTYAKDLLEFGHNQGWDSGPFGGNDWYFQTKFPDRWAKIVDVATKYGFEVLPYYEYAGSKGYKGYGFEKRAKPLTRDDAYTHVSWSEDANVDVTDPATLADVGKLLDATVGSLKGKGKFLGAWFRTRVSNMPMGFGDATLARFSTEANGGAKVDRAMIAADKTLEAKYATWWYGKRKDFLVALRDKLRAVSTDDATLYFTSYTDEPGPNLPGGIVTDDMTRVAGIKGGAQLFADVVSKDKWLDATLAPPGTWGGWEWQHSIPPADPSRYKDVDGVQLTYPFQRLYSVSSSTALDAFRNKSGLAMIRHYSLNENSMDDLLGYFVSDVDRAGPYSMMPEARAVAFGDPTSIGYLSSSDFNRGFPEYVRAFHAAYLALPALPSTVVAGASTEKEIVARSIATPKDGTFLAVVNVGLVDHATKVKLPVSGHVQDLVTLAEVPVVDGAVDLSFYPGELKSLRITDAPVDPGTPPGSDAGVAPGEDSGTAPPASADPTTSSDSGCGCRLAMKSPSGGAFALFAVLALIMRKRAIRVD